MASQEMIRAAEKVIAEGGNVGDAIDAAITARVKEAHREPAVYGLFWIQIGDRYVTDQGLLRFFEVAAQ